ncbi:MAG TPA: UDP-N-acetylmuramoyl-tripeptide--D-alanyl-D-alanine ligase, partial [Oxalicibacterium sp.]|nr:UDP-N-acetylmuramoyl-tripeptide--D-alanyl-D-alanine ligase [Oxalicibacterium sp.]
MMRLSEAALATHGRILGRDVIFTSVGTDSRSLVPGQLFVALRGEQFDGHAYVQQCLQQGAAAVMVSTQPTELEAGLLVTDTRLALGDLAGYWRRKFAIPLAAITGSNGKTTVKEMLACILHAATGGADAVLATQGNLNNDIGMPLTLLKLRETHRYAVAEMGMNHAGEIRYLTRICRPTVALVNNATSAHLGGLGSVEAIAQAKGEIYEGLADDGIAIINADDAFAPLWSMLAAPHKVLRFGLEHAADVSADYRLEGNYSNVRVKTAQGDIEFRLHVPGLHNVRNALAAATAAFAMHVPLAKIGEGLAEFGGVKGRLQYKPGLQGALVIDDTYNANPASMKAAIDVLAAQAKQKLLVLGDMGELGADAAHMHAEIGSYAQHAGIDALYTLGELSRGAAAAFDGARHFDTLEALIAAVTADMGSGSVVLVKGSRFMRMERVVAAIVQNGAPPAIAAGND